MSFKTLNTVRYYRGREGGEARYIYMYLTKSKIVSRLPERKVSEILTKAEQGGAYVNPGTNEFLASIVAAAADASAALPSSKSTLLLSTSPNSKDLASTAKTLLQSSSSMTNVSPIGASVNNNRSTSSASKSGGSGRRSSGPVRSFFSRVRRFFDWCTPYMVTIMFIIHMHRLIRDLRGRRTIGG